MKRRCGLLRWWSETLRKGSSLAPLRALTQLLWGCNCCKRSRSVSSSTRLWHLVFITKSMAAPRSTSWLCSAIRKCRWYWSTPGSSCSLWWKPNQGWGRPHLGLDHSIRVWGTAVAARAVYDPQTGQTQHYEREDVLYDGGLVGLAVQSMSRDWTNLLQKIVSYLCQRLSCLCGRVLCHTFRSMRQGVLLCPLVVLAGLLSADAIVVSVPCVIPVAGTGRCSRRAIPYVSLSKQ